MFMRDTQNEIKFCFVIFETILLIAGTFVCFQQLNIFEWYIV